MNDSSSVIQPTNAEANINGGRWISDASYWMPRHVVESAWHGHAPFAFWLVDAIRPKSVVELGTHNGFSYFVFCEAIRRLGLSAKSFALDSWEGDDQTGFYGAEVFENVLAINAAEYADFSTLLRGLFDEGLDSIAEGSVDLLHVDGHHGYDDVRHDFEGWRPKLTDRGVVLFHDVAERQEGFGVWRFWAEISEQYPSFAFGHEHGLGLLAVGRDVPQKLREFLAATVDHADAIRDFYSAIGTNVSHQYAVSMEVQRVRLDAERLQIELNEASQRLDFQTRLVDRREAQLHGLRQQISELRQSTSWKATRPLRAASDLIHRRKA